MADVVSRRTRSMTGPSFDFRDFTLPDHDLMPPMGNRGRVRFAANLFLVGANVLAKRIRRFKPTLASRTFALTALLSVRVPKEIEDHESCRTKRFISATLAFACRRRLCTASLFTAALEAELA